MKKAFLMIPIILSACANAPASYDRYFADKGLTAQTPDSFQHCHGYGCKFIKDLSLTTEDWAEIEASFSPTPKNAAAEREAIKPAIALFEQKIGTLAGTSGDIYGTFRKLGDNQLDCVDESTNTTIYLTLLQQRGVLNFHDIEAPTMRLPLIHSGRWPHQTAVMQERETQQRFAVDSWFHDNGHPPEIVPLKQWKDGFNPNHGDDS